jgi:beta-galactosidase/evolved beta-galactosidase subunit alpha
MEVRECGTETVVEGTPFLIAIDRVRGSISRWQWNGVDLLADGPRLDLWRAPTDNDLGWNCAGEWRAAGLDALQHRVDRVDVHPVTPGIVRIVVETRVAPPIRSDAFLCRYTYTVCATGDVRVVCHGEPVGTWPRLPRIGLRLAVPAELDRVAWYGLGPEETYPDSRQAGRMDVYTGTVDDLHTPYVFPQENGSRSGTRWVALTDLRGVGLLAVAEPELSFCAQRYTPEDLAEARHTSELEARDTVTWHLDYRQRGLGSASCGPDVLPQYELQPHAFDFSVRLKPFSVDEAPPAIVAKQAFPET